MPRLTWLALGYNVPANPSRNRVYIWRKLKEYGAGYFRPGVAILPKSTQNLTKLRQLAGKIRDMDGEAVIAELRFLDDADETQTVERFRSQSEGEYRELIQDCVSVVDKLKQNLFPADERKELVRRARRRLAQARNRDYFKAGSGDSLEVALEELIEDIGKLF